MKRFAVSTIAAGVLGASLLAPAAHASMTPAQPLGSPLRFTVIQYNPPGDDEPPTNVKLNAEYVTIYNPTTTSRSVTGFRVHDRGPDHTYRFGTLTLGAHKSVRLHTGSGANTATNRYWGLDNYVWNNDGDTATLESSIGATVDSCTWGAGSGIIHC